MADSWRHIKNKKDMNPIAKITAKIGKTTFIILIIIVVLLVALRIALPYISKSYINKMLANTPGYRGHVEDVDISLLRGAYALNDIVIKKATGARVEFVFGFRRPVRLPRRLRERRA
jgi:ABC-type multidrug transport system fused ATPase/permease subunit